LRLDDKVYGFSFYLWEMQLVLRSYVETSAGFRCVAATTKILSGYFDIRRMSYTTVRRWLCCYGYFLLTQTKVKRDGYWVLLTDFSIQLGQEKCLLTLGVSLERMRAHGFNVTHKDVEVLDIVVTLHSSSKLVKERLEVVSNRVGIPAQVVSDHGSDIKKGNELFCQQHPTVVYTYDMSHKTGCLLKALLENDRSWKSLLKTINISLQQVQQTELSFLRPVLPRKKSRYLNLSIIVNWVNNMLCYQDRNDFSLIESGYMIHPESVYQITNSHCDKQTINSLLNMTRNKFTSPKDIVDQLSLILQHRVDETEIEIIDLSAQRVKEKFGLFEQYREVISDLSSMIDMIEKIQQIVKHQGLSTGTMKEIEQPIEIQEVKGDKTRQIYYQIINYLTEELSKFKDPTKAYLVSSDIEESLFGKYKYKLAERMGGIYGSVLLICALCSDFNIDDIKSACQKYKMQDVDNFIKQMTGRSIQSKRRLAFKNTS